MENNFKTITMKKINTLFTLMFVIGCFSISTAQLVQVKDLEFLDQAGDWTALDKTSGSSYQITKDSENGTEGVFYIDIYKTKKLESDASAIKTAFDTHVSDQAFDSKSNRTLTDLEEQGTDGLEITAYQYDENESGLRIWAEVWLFTHEDSGKTYVFTGVLKNTKSGVSEPLKSDLKMMLGTVRVIAK